MASLTNHLQDIMDSTSTVTVRPPKRPAPQYSERAQARLIRQKIMEQEQELEDRDALRITAEELNILKQSFSSVKAEFLDLDGLSWETPSAQQILKHWHTEEAARRKAISAANIGGVRMRRAHPRRSLSNLLSSAAAATPQPSASAPELSACAVDEDDFNEETLRGCPTTPARINNASIGHTNIDIPDRELGRTPLPELFSTTHDDDCTPKPPTGDPTPGDDDYFSSAPPMSVPAHARPTIPKSLSAPSVPSIQDPAFLQAPSARPTKRLPPSKIPILRSKSLSAKPSMTPTTASVHPPSFAFSVPEETAGLDPVARRTKTQTTDTLSTSPRSPRKMSVVHSPPTRAVLTNSPTLNQSCFSRTGTADTNANMHAEAEVGTVRASPSMARCPTTLDSAHTSPRLRSPKGVQTGERVGVNVSVSRVLAAAPSTTRRGTPSANGTGCTALSVSERREFSGTGQRECSTTSKPRVPSLP